MNDILFLIEVIDNMDYSNDLKKLREKMLLTQEEFGKLIGVSFETVNRWENGRHTPTMKAKRKISKLANKYEIFSDKE